MDASLVTAMGALLVALGGLLKVLLDSRRVEKRWEEQLVERRDTRATRLGDLMYERLQTELTRADARLQQCEQRHLEDQRTIRELQRRNAELEEGRIRREQQLTELQRQIEAMGTKVDTLQTGMFQRLERGDSNDGG